MNNFLSIKSKAWILFSASILVVIGLVIFIIFFLYQNLYLNNEKDRLLETASALSHSYINMEQEEFEEKLEWTLDTSLERAVVTDDPMMLGAALPLHGPADELIINEAEREMLLNGEIVTILRDHENLDTRILGIAVPVMTNGFPKAIILVYRPVTDINDAFRQLVPLMAGAGLIFLFVLFILMQRVQQQYIDPLVDLERGAKKLAEGKYRTDLPVKVNNELSRLADAFRFLSESLADEDEKKKAFIQNISHELRTPLSYIKGYSELLNEANVNEDPALYKTYSEIIFKEANRMTRLVDQLINLTKLEESTSESFEFQPLVLSELINQSVQSTHVKREQKHQTLHTELNDDLIVSGDEDRLLQVFINILDNASSYTGPYGSISVRTRPEKNYAVIEIEDTGEGIREEDLPFLTERFFRTDKSRARKKGGVGIGLSIVSQIVKLHNGSLKFDSVLEKGTTVTITIPLYDES